MRKTLLMELLGGWFDVFAGVGTALFLAGVIVLVVLIIDKDLHTRR